MARKIKISSKAIKKSILITLLVALVVGLGVIVVQSFGKDNILSNNTVLNDLDYSDEYRLYLEKQLIIKSNTDSYENVLEAQKVIEVNSITTLKEAKILEATKIADEKIADINTRYDGYNASDTERTEKKIAEIEASSMSDSQKASEKVKAENELQATTHRSAAAWRNRYLR